jgi:hypothetical protein
MSSRKIRDLAVAGLFVVAVLVFHYALDESWPNSLAIATFGSIPGLAFRFFRRSNTVAERNGNVHDDRVEDDRRQDPS